MSLFCLIIGWAMDGLIDQRITLREPSKKFRDSHFDELVFEQMNLWRIQWSKQQEANEAARGEMCAVIKDDTAGL